MKTGRWKTWVLIGMAMLLLVPTAVLTQRIKQMRREYDFDPADPLKDEIAASELRLPIAALSVFRSLAIDYLWIRAETLKQEGHHFDALHLSRLICTLAPNLEKVWEYHAWNMAYNISVATENPPERWNWVMAGIRLLRDEGLKHNPRSPQLYSYLATIFQHKLGEYADRANRYYKHRMALEMMKLVGRRQETMNAALESLKRAPRQWSQIIADPNVAELVARIQKVEPERFPDDTAIQERFLDYISYPQSFDYPKEFLQLISTYRPGYALRKLNAHLRRDELWVQWKMDPAIMLELNDTFGPRDPKNQENRMSLDWRHPVTHGIYWAWKGKHYTSIKDHHNYIRIRRNIYHSMQKLFEMGHITVLRYGKPEVVTAREPGQEIVDQIARNHIDLFTSQDIRMFEPAYRATLEVIQSYIDLGEEVPNNIQSATANLLWTGIANIYLTGDKNRAMRYFLDLRTRFPGNPDYFKKETAEDSLYAFVLKNIQTDINEITLKDAGNFVDSLLRQSYGAISQNNPELAAERELKARQIHTYYQTTSLEPGSDRANLLPFPKMQFEAMANFLDDPQVNFTLKGNLLTRLRIESPSQYNRVMEALEKRRRSSDGTLGSP